jgi:hypothetical protein
VAEVASAAVEAGRSIGRYFTVISLVPSLLFVLYVYGLFAAGAWPGPFEPAKALHAAGNLSIAQIVALLVAALLLGLVLHPFQFSMTQLLEGYWGGSWIGLHLAQRRIMHYRRAVRALDKAAKKAEYEWVRAVERDRTTEDRLKRESPQRRREMNAEHLNKPPGDPIIADYLRAQALRAALRQYPDARRRMMPTRLGNVLRRYEDKAGKQYGLSIVRVAPHLNLVALPEHRAYVDDCRKGLDLGVRLCVLFAFATALSVVLLVRDGAWLFLALAPYAVSYLAYRGATSSAHAYGTALLTLVDLDRFALYEQLHVPPPSSTKVEQERNALLSKVLSGDRRIVMDYAPPKDTPAVETGAPATETGTPSQ